MLPCRSRIFAASQQITRHILFGTRNGSPTARFARIQYSTSKETAGLDDTLVSRSDDEPQTLPPLKILNAVMTPTPVADHEIPLPEKVLRPSYPSPHLNLDQIREYLYPLYSRKWGIQSHGKGWSLSLDLEFSKFQHLCAILPLLNEVMKKERHHSFVGYEFKVLRIRSQTHDAIASLGDIDITPGVSMHDVSLAINIEHQLEPFFQRREVMRLTQKFQPGKLPRPFNCRICGRAHRTSDCRDTGQALYELRRRPLDQNP